MTTQSITVQTNVAAPIEKVWAAYTTPEDIMQWNFASNDWHTPHAMVDLREGGAFSSRMEAKDGSMGFDFAGTYTKIETHKLIQYQFGDRHAKVAFTPDQNGVHVAVTFEAETDFRSSNNAQAGSPSSTISNDTSRPCDVAKKRPKQHSMDFHRHRWKWRACGEKPANRTR